MVGDAYRSRPTPSTYASSSEYRSLNRVLRRWERIWQGVPNVSTKWNVLLFLLGSAGLFRLPLKTAIISLVDTKANRAAMFLASFIAGLFNTWLRADLRYQSLPTPFELWVDELEVPIFEELPGRRRSTAWTRTSAQRCSAILPTAGAFFGSGRASSAAGPTTETSARRGSSRRLRRAWSAGALERSPGTAASIPSTPSSISSRSKETRSAGTRCSGTTGLGGSDGSSPTLPFSSASRTRGPISST